MTNHFNLNIFVYISPGHCHLNNSQKSFMFDEILIRCSRFNQISAEKKKNCSIKMEIFEENINNVTFLLHPMGFSAFISA